MVAIPTDVTVSVERFLEAVRREGGKRLNGATSMTPSCPSTGLRTCGKISFG